MQILACFCLYLVLTGAALAILIIAATDAGFSKSNQTFTAATACAVGIGYLLAASYMGWTAVKIWKLKGKAPDLALPHRDSPEVHLGRQGTKAS